MIECYHNLAKKSTVILLLIIFLFNSTEADAMTPTDPEYSKQEAIWQQIGAQKAWDYTIGSNHVTVAVIDTGVDIWHDDLKKNIWTNPYEIPGNNYDDDGNGFVDDVHGWNFVENNNDVRTSVFNATDDQGAVSHGTIIAGLIGAVGDNGQSGVGLNWKVKIMPLRAIDNEGNGSYKEVSEAVLYAMNNGADVISLSVVGTHYDESLKNILKLAYDRGIVIVSAAGNDQLNGTGNLTSNQHYPVCLDNGSAVNWIIGVSSVDENDRLSNFADYGSCVDLVAPGEGIYSTQRYAPAYGYEKEFNGPWQGTSFSVPLVAGAAALLKAAHPAWSAGKIISSLLKNSDDIQGKNLSFASEIGFGRLNIGKALENSPDVEVTDNYFSLKKYYFDSNTIYTKENGAHYFFAGSGDSKIVAIDSVRSLNEKNDEVYALVTHGKYYFVDFFNYQGRKWKEVAVPVEDYSVNRLPVNIKVLVNDDKRTVQLEFLETIKKNGKKTTKNTVFKAYDWLDNN